MEREENAPRHAGDFSIAYQLTHGVIVDILSNGLWQGACGFDNVGFDEADYDEAKEALKAKGFERELCVEDVFAQMLLMGRKLRLHMAEEREDEKWYELTLDKLIEGVKAYAKKPVNGSLYDLLEGDPNGRLDSHDYDAVLQYACYGDVIIG